MFYNPYAGIDWDTVQQIKSSSHLHANRQERYDNVYAHGYRHIMNTLYVPAHPQYPLQDYLDIDSDVISSPGSEKVKFSDKGGHYTAIGSFHKSDGHDTQEGQEIPWADKMNGVFNELQFPNGGGVVWAHPSNTADDAAKKMVKDFLDFDERCLGLEIYNNGHRYRSSHDRYPSAYQELWDYALSTKRKCFGFAVVDWAIEDGLPFWGANMLLIDEWSEHEVLKAYRDGRFYCIIRDTGLRLLKHEFNDEELTVEVNKPCNIKFITEQGVSHQEENTKVANYQSNGHTYVRVEAEDINPPKDMFYDEREQFQSSLYNTLYTQAVMLSEEIEVPGVPQDILKEKRKRRLLLG